MPAVRAGRGRGLEVDNFGRENRGKTQRRLAGTQKGDLYGSADLG